MKLTTKLKTSMYRLYYRNFSTTKWKVVKFFDTEFVLCPTNYIDRRIWIEGAYEKEQLDFLLTVTRLKQFDFFLDVGANFGLYSTVIARKTRISEIHSFECDPRNIAQFQGHIAMNNLTQRISLHPYAIGDTESAISFQMASEGNTGHSHVAFDAENYDVIHGNSDSLPSNLIEVEQKPIDSVLKVTDKYLLIKIDVEGYEQKVLQGMIKLLSSNFCVIQIEIIDNDSKLSEILEELGYKSFNRIGADFYFTNVPDFIV